MLTNLDSELIIEHVEEVKLEDVLAFDQVELDEFADFQRLFEVLRDSFSDSHLDNFLLNYPIWFLLIR